MAGINRALHEPRGLVKEAVKRPCIFLSHISVDKSAAVAIGDYITRHGDIDIYLDIQDADLQRAVQMNDPNGVTKFIERGLSASTHIMCLISSETSKSWWVPYELGFAKRSNIHLSCLKLKDAALPEYLKISEIIPGTKSLNIYLNRLKIGLTKLAESKSLLETGIPSYSANHPLDPFLEWSQ